MNQSKYFRTEVLPVLMIGVISALCFRIVYDLHGDWQELISATVGVTEGKPHWRAYQNRLLGPYIVLGIDHFIHSLKSSLLLFIAIGLLAHNFLMYYLLKSRHLSKEYSILAVLIWSFFFTTLQHRWLYTWDMVDLSLFTFTAFVLVFQLKPILLLYIFPLAILNRESALFIPIAYMIVVTLQSLNNYDNRQSIFKNMPCKKLLLGLALIVIGAIYTKLVRDFLFIEQAWGGDDLDHAMLGNHIYLLPNLKDLAFRNFLSYNILHNIPLLMCVAYHANVLVFSKNRGAQAGALFFFVLMTNILIFGIINETRMLLPIISLTMFVFIAERECPSA